MREKETSRHHVVGVGRVSLEVGVGLLFAISIIADEIFPLFSETTGASFGRLLLPAMAFFLVANLRNFRPAPGLHYFTGWLAVCALSVLIVQVSSGSSYSLADSYIISYASSIIAFQFIYQFIQTKQDFERFLYGYLASIVLGLVYMAVTGDLVYYEDRLRSTLSNANGLGRMVGLAMLITFFSSLKGHKWAIALTLFLFVMLLLTGSRGSLIATLAASLFMMIMGKKSVKKRSYNLIILVLLIGVGWQLFLQESGSFEHRYMKMMAIEDVIDTTHRSDIFMASLQMITDHPIWGVGVDQVKSLLFNNYGENLPPIIYILMKKGELDTHNTFLFILAGTGIVGFVPFAWALWEIGRFNYLSKKMKVHYADLSIAIFIFFILASLIGTLVTQKLFWFGLGLSVIGSSIVDEDRPTQRQDSGH